MSLLKFVIITLFLNTHYDASEGVQKDVIDILYVARVREHNDWIRKNN